MTNKELIKVAVKHSNPRLVDGQSDRWIGDVAASLVTDKGNIYSGICTDISSGLGFCAERAAISQMLDGGEEKVVKIVAIWNNNPDKDLYVLPPCGACREYMRQVCVDGLDTEVVLGLEKSMYIRELLPMHAWPEEKVQL